jgi:TolB protein
MSYLITARLSRAVTKSRENHDVVMLNKAKHWLQGTGCVSLRNGVCPRLNTPPPPTPPPSRGRVREGGRAILIAALVSTLLMGTVSSLPPKVSLNDTEPEQHLRNIRQLTSGRQNAEAYFSFDGSSLIFQSTRDGRDCYQEYVMSLASGEVRLVSTGQGATTCGYFLPGDRRVLFSSSHLKSPLCPPKPSAQGRYLWALDDYDIFTANLRGEQLVRLTSTPGYDAEATIAPDGSRIVFTSVRDGDLDIYSMHLDGTDVKRLTGTLGYDGGPFFSPDSKRIVYRANHSTDPEEVARYKELLGRNLVEPSKLEIFVMDADGQNQRQITKNGAANFAPFFHPDGRRIMFSSNLHDPEGRKFDLFLINDDGHGLEQITSRGKFNSFPMFSPDGKKLVWVSDRDAQEKREFNIFLAEWVP